MIDDIKITKAMERIEQLFYETNGKCCVSFSGGKDSTVILALIKMCEELYTIPPNGITAIFSNTGLELGAIVDFVKWCKSEWYPNIQIIRPEKSFYYIINKYGKPIKSKVKSEFLYRYQNGNRSKNTMTNLLGEDGKVVKSKIANKDLHLLHDDFDIKISNKCCELLKKKPIDSYHKQFGFKGYIVGERVAEGGVRATNTQKRINDGGKICTKLKGNYVVKLPIIDWTDEDVDSFIEKYNVPLSKAYTEQGYKRTGCLLCPFSLQIDKNLEKLYLYEPNRYKASMFWLKDVFIAQNIKLLFDEQYETEREKK